MDAIGGETSVTMIWLRFESSKAKSQILEFRERSDDKSQFQLPESAAIAT